MGEREEDCEMGEVGDEVRVLFAGAIVSGDVDPHIMTATMSPGVGRGGRR